MRRRALENLEREGISTTLVVTLKKGVNDGEIGDILRLAASHPCVRGVTFQPIQSAGRLEGFDPAKHRLTLTEVRREILRQWDLFAEADLVPVPCHADAIAMGYAIRRGGRLHPLSRFISPQALMNLGGNTICYEQDPKLREHVMNLFSTSASPTSAAVELNSLCCALSCSPGLPTGAESAGRTQESSATGGLAGSLSYQDVFRVIIMQFMDAWSMDLRSLKRSRI